MHPTPIITSTYLDILFDNRNKEYGAYELRLHYRDRLLKSIAITIVTVGCVSALYYFVPSSHPELLATSSNQIIKLIEIPPNEALPDVPKPPPPLPAPQRATVKNFIPVITKDAVKPDDMPPDIDELETHKIGNANIDGPLDDNLVSPPMEDPKGVIALPVSGEEASDKIFQKVEIESSYPGGPNAWKRFLIKTVQYPEKAVEKIIEGGVTVRFIVDVDGTLSEIIAVDGREELRKEAVRVIAKSGRWTPAIQNGRLVKSYKQQIIIFQLAK